MIKKQFSSFQTKRDDKLKKHIIDQTDILRILVLQRRWMSTKEIIKILKLEYEPVTRVKMQRKLSQLQKFGFIMSKMEKSIKQGRAPYMFKAKRQI